MALRPWLTTPEAIANREAGLLRHQRAMALIRNPPTEVPTMKDIAWAAGIYEGEGSVSRDVNCTGYWSGIRISVTQKDRWLLHRLKALFGGTIATQKTNVPYPCSEWRLASSRANGF